MPKWEDVEGDLEPNLRELLAPKTKKHPLQNQMTHPNVSGSEALMAGLCTNYEGVWGQQVKYKQAPPKRGSARVWSVA